MSETIKAYKGFNEDMTCTPPNTDIRFQYEEGKEYEESKARACERGFHACGTYPMKYENFSQPKICLLDLKSKCNYPITDCANCPVRKEKQ